MKERIHILFLALLMLPMTLEAVGGGDDNDKIKGKHRGMVEEADFFFSIDDHFMSRKIYQDLVELYPEHADFNFRLGFCYLHIRNEEKMAIPYLEKSSRLGNTSAYFFLAEAYHLDEQFHKALDALDKYRKSPDHTLTHARIDRTEIRIETAMEMMGYPIEVEIEKLGSNVNSDYQDYAPTIDSEGKYLYFTSRRPESTGGFTDPDENYFEDIFVSQCVQDSWTEASPVTGPINEEGHDANVNFSASGNKMILYRTHKNLYSGDLYISEKGREGWSKPELMDDAINTSKYHEPSAAFSPDEQDIYIVSDRPGGFGGKDIYVIRKLPNDQWSEPRNLGREINSPFDEDAPFLSLDGQSLYFSSMGHNSIGGYDIFQTKRDEDGEWTKTKHLGYPINSVYDDIYFSLTADGKRGFLSTSREGNMDIYEVDMIYEAEDLVVVKGYMTDSAGQPVMGSISVIDNRTGQEVVTVIPNRLTGKYVAAIMPDRSYTIRSDAEGYQATEHTIEVHIEAKGDFNIHELDLNLRKE